MPTLEEDYSPTLGAGNNDLLLDALPRPRAAVNERSEDVSDRDNGQITPTLNSNCHSAAVARSNRESVNDINTSNIDNDDGGISSSDHNIHSAEAESRGRDDAEIFDNSIVNEGLRLNRIGENRVHHDPGYQLYDDVSDDPDLEMDGAWMPVDPRITNITVNGAKRQQWKYCKSELKQIKDRCKHLFGKDPSNQDVVNYFYGPQSPLFTLFRDRLHWNHKEFLDFMATNNVLAENSFSAAQLYDKDFTTDISGLLEREDFTAKWRQISLEGVPETSTRSATSQPLLWEETEAALNKSLRTVLIEGRQGSIINLLDDDKNHHESHPSKNRNMNVKIIKHVNDNRWGPVLDTLCNPSLHFATNIRVHRKNSTQLENTKAQFFGSAYGSDANRTQDLNYVHLHNDRAFGFEKQHQQTFGPSKLRLTSTAARAKTLAFNYGQTPSSNDRRIYLAEGGISSLRLMKKVCHGRRIVNGAFNTGTTVVLYLTTEYRTMEWDIVTTGYWANLWNNDRQRLREEGYSMELSISAIKSDMNLIHRKFMQKFFDLPIVQVTTCSNSREWHIARRMSFTSRQTYALVCMLKKHFKDLEDSNVRLLFEFMYPKSYNYTSRGEEKANLDKAAEEAANGSGEEEVIFESSRNIDDLFAAEDGTLTVEEEVRRDLHMFNNAMFDQDDFSYMLGGKGAAYCKEFLRQVRCSQPIPTTNHALQNKCKKYADAPSSSRNLVLRSKEELQQIYERKHVKPFTRSWTIPKLMEKILEDVEITEEDDSFEQMIMNTIVKQMCLPHMSNDSRDACDKGNEMESVFAKQMMELSKNGSFPFQIQDVSKVGLIEKTDRHCGSVKASVDRILGIKDGNEERLVLLELKTRVSQLEVQKEEDRIVDLRGCRLLGEDDIYLEMSSDDPLSHLAIRKPDERLQVLHHAYTYSQKDCIHAVGNTSELMSVCKMTFPQTLLDAYGNVLDLLYEAGVGIFYRDGAIDNIDADEDEISRIKKAVEKNESTFQEGMSRFEFNYRLWRKSLLPIMLPLPPSLQWLPLALANWNIMKPSGDMITQMIWKFIYYPPHNNIQSALVKKLLHMIPAYSIHRLFQLNSSQSYRDHVGRNKTFWKSLKLTTSILRTMSAQYDPERPLPLTPSRTNVQTPNNVPLKPAFFPHTGTSPKKRKREFYAKKDNSHHYVYQRHHRCPGIVQMKCDAQGNPVRNKTCAYCQKGGASWYCGICHNYFHNTIQNISRRGSGEIPVMATPNGETNAAGEPQFDYFRATCSDFFHNAARQQYYSVDESMSRPLLCQSVVPFDINVHNLSFEEETESP